MNFMRRMYHGFMCTIGRHEWDYCPCAAMDDAGVIIDIACFRGAEADRECHAIPTTQQQDTFWEQNTHRINEFFADMQ